MPQVEILNAARAVEARPGQTILDAALDAGIDYPHGCRSGRCGTCKSRLARGEVDLLPHTRFALSDVEKAAGLILACRAQPSTDAAVAWLGDEEDAQPGHPVRDLMARVEGVQAATHDIRVLRFKPEGAPLAFSAGQYATLALPGAPPRDYSMASRPGEQVLDFHVRLVPGGATSPLLHGALGPGDRVGLRGPFGSSFLRVGHAGPILAVAGGSGLGAILSIVESAVALGMRQPIRIYHGARAERDLYGAERLAAIAQQHGDLRFEPVLSRPEGPTPRRTGSLAEAVAADLVDLDGWKAYVAGPPGMVEAIAARAGAAGLRRTDLHADIFFTPETYNQRRSA